MKEKRFTPRALIITAILAVLLTLGGVALTAWLRLGSGGLALLQAMDLSRSRFVGDYDSQAGADAALDALAASLDDRWSGYYAPAEYDAIVRRRANTYVGVGLTYQMEPGGWAMVVIGLTPDGPAEQAGILVGDRITAIDGVALTAENFDALVATIRSEGVRDITFTVETPGQPARQVALRTADMDSSPVSYALLDSGIGYVRLANFYQNSARDFNAAVDELVEQGARALLFDVRHDPGGYIAELTGMLDHLLPEGAIFVERAKGGPVKTTTSDAGCVELPMAVLIDADSYSAAEFFAAQLRESAGAFLIGQQTCGKGYYQQMFPLLNGGGLNLSTGLYTTGGGTSLIGVGVAPDLTVEEPEAQLEQAIAWLEERVG